MITDVNKKELPSKCKIKYIGGAFTHSNKIPVGTIGDVINSQVYWENGVTGRITRENPRQIKIIQLIEDNVKIGQGSLF